MRSLDVARGVLAVGIGFSAFSAFGAVGCSDTVTSKAARSVPAQVSGAVFTTLVDGVRVNANIYQEKEDVYLDGGPGPNAPISAAGLPEGDYFFQVTDPSGKELLSTDHVSCRKVRVNSEGVIDHVYSGTNYEKHGKGMVPVSCLHSGGVDLDHGALTVQLFPYDDTPNRGGVYKVWVTPVGQYAGDPNFVPSSHKDAVSGEHWVAGNAHGFVPQYSKTDNYKVKRRGRDRPPSELVIKKFHDKNANGMMDADEELILGWEVGVTDPLLASNYHYTTAYLMVSQGLWSAIEATPSGTRQTVSILDGQVLSLFPNAIPQVDVDVFADTEELHELVYGNVGLGVFRACKVFDRNGNGLAEQGEPKVPGWPMVLTGTTVRGNEIAPRQKMTGANGCAGFGGLLPGSYTVTEGEGGGTWQATGMTYMDGTVESTLDGSTLSGSVHKATFTNVCTLAADFGTKGYWHNKNGLAEIDHETVDAVNQMAPYSAPSTYFGAGDEPFDGTFDGGELVPAAQGPAGDTIANEGTALAEISSFLIDANSGGDPKEQLAQQLLAFYFNVTYRLDGGDAMIEVDGEFVSAMSLIDEALAAYAGDDASLQTSVKSKLDMLNNSDALPYIPAGPCEVVLPAEE